MKQQTDTHKLNCKVKQNKPIGYTHTHSIDNKAQWSQ